MEAGYTATQQRNYPTALLYFKRALDERPNDSFAMQAIQNVEAYLNPAAKPNPPTQAALTQTQAVAIVTRWLQAKAEIFAPPFDQQQASQLTTGELYNSLVKPKGSLDWLKANRAYYRYGVQKVDAVIRFAAAENRATIELQVTEDRTLYRNGTIDPSQTDFTTRRVRYTLERTGGTWKIADYKTIDGALLERSMINFSTSKQ
jgi:hypothetical protein